VSVVVAVLATLWAMLLIWIVVSFGRWARRKWRARRPGWWRLRSRTKKGVGSVQAEQSPVPANDDTPQNDERTPLLDAA
jgi:hypothetical protein